LLQSYGQTVNITHRLSKHNGASKMNAQQPNANLESLEQTAKLLGVPVDAVEFAAGSCARELVRLFGSTEEAIKALKDDLEKDGETLKAVVSYRKRKHKFMCINFYKNIEQVEKMVYDMLKNPLTGEQK
jgi:hypothetical protein